MSVVYLGALLVSITGMVVLDRRFSLFFWADVRRATIVLPAGVVLFLVWDLLGIGLGIFFRGQTPFMTGVLVAPELPVEELLFLTLLCYLTMNVFSAASRLGRRPVPEPVAATQPPIAPPPVPEPVEGTHPAGDARRPPVGDSPVPEPVEGTHPAGDARRPPVGNSPVPEPVEGTHPEEDRP